MIVLSVMQAIQKMVTIILQIILNHFFIFIFLYNYFFFFQYLKISNDSLEKYYQKNIERLLKKLAEGIKKQITTICSPTIQKSPRK